MISQKKRTDQEYTDVLFPDFKRNFPKEFAEIVTTLSEAGYRRTDDILNAGYFMIKQCRPKYTAGLFVNESNRHILDGIYDTLLAQRKLKEEKKKSREENRIKKESEYNFKLCSILNAEKVSFFNINHSKSIPEVTFRLNNVYQTRFVFRFNDFFALTTSLKLLKSKDFIASTTFISQSLDLKLQNVLNLYANCKFVYSLKIDPIIIHVPKHYIENQIEQGINRQIERIIKEKLRNYHGQADLNVNATHNRTKLTISVNKTTILKNFKQNPVSIHTVVNEELISLDIDNLTTKLSESIKSREPILLKRLSEVIQESIQNGMSHKSVKKRLNNFIVNATMDEPELVKELKKHFLVQTINNSTKKTPVSKKNEPTKEIKNCQDRSSSTQKQALKLLMEKIAARNK